VFGGDVLEAGGTHRTGTKHDLTCSGVEGFEKLDDARHRVRREETKVDDHFEIVPKEEKCILSGGNGEVAPVLDAEMLPSLRGRAVCPRARTRGRWPG
jgi:hypothetical protein